MKPGEFAKYAAQIGHKLDPMGGGSTIESNANKMLMEANSRIGRINSQSRKASANFWKELRRAPEKIMGSLKGNK